MRPKSKKSRVLAGQNLPQKVKNSGTRTTRSFLLQNMTIRMSPHGPSGLAASVATGHGPHVTKQGIHSIHGTMCEMEIRTSEQARRENGRKHVLIALLLLWVWKSSQLPDCEHRGYSEPASVGIGLLAL